MRKIAAVSRNRSPEAEPRQGVGRGSAGTSSASAAGTVAVRSVSRALDLLAAVVRADGSVGVSELAAESGLPVGTVHRLLAALAEKGLVRRDAGTRRYSVGWAAIGLASRIGRRGGLAADAEPWLRRLVELTGESANLAVLDGGAAVYVAHVQSPRTVRMFTEAGNQAPLHASGTGKVLLANLPEERREALLEALALERHTAQTITEVGALRRELERVRRRGYALDNGEFEDGVRCIAVPVRDASRDVVAALSVSGPTSRLTADRAAGLVPAILALAGALTGTLGSTP